MPSIVLRLCYVLLIGAVVIASFAYFQLTAYMKTPLTIEGDGLMYKLERGGNLTSAAHALTKQGVLENPRWLTAFSRLTGQGQAVKAGEYWLPSGITPTELIEKLELGDVHYYQVTLVEGWTVADVVEHLAEQPALVRDLKIDVNKHSGFFSGLELGLDTPKENVEGLLFPDTYRFQRGSTTIDVIRQAYQRMQKILAQEWENRSSGLPYKSSYEALIMASLIEKETGVARERGEIAGVFIRRLLKRMRLQTDPAVIYGLGKVYKGNLRSRHLKDSSNLYNTYRHGGLTPTPIALAGREAIHAALHPVAGTSLYFVAKGDGSHYFSDTLEEHQKAVRKYQIEQRRKDYSSAPKSSTSG